MSSALDSLALPIKYSSNKESIMHFMFYLRLNSILHSSFHFFHSYLTSISIVRHLILYSKAFTLFTVHSIVAGWSRITVWHQILSLLAHKTHSPWPNAASGNVRLIPVRLAPSLNTHVWGLNCYLEVLYSGNIDSIYRLYMLELLDRLFCCCFLW